VAEGLGAACLPLHDEPPGVVDGHRPCGVALAASADRHPVAGHKAPGAVLVQTVEVRAEGQQLAGDLSRQRSPAHRRRPAGVEAARDGPQLLGPVLRAGGEVEANTRHQPFQLAALKVGPGLGQDAADLFAVVVKVVDPLDAQLQPAELLHGPADGHRRADGDGLRLGHGQAGPQHQREIDALSRRAFKPPPQPSPARRLLAGKHHRAMRRTLKGQRLGGAVGAFQRVVEEDGRVILPHRLGTEGVAPRQPIAPPGGSFQRIALRRQRGGGLVDGGAAHAQLPGQLLARDALALRGGKGRQEGLFCGRGHRISSFWCVIRAFYHIFKNFPTILQVFAPLSRMDRQSA